MSAISHCIAVEDAIVQVNAQRSAYSWCFALPAMPAASRCFMSGPPLVRRGWLGKPCMRCKKAYERLPVVFFVIWGVFLDWRGLRFLPMRMYGFRNPGVVLAVARDYSCEADRHDGPSIAPLFRVEMVGFEVESADHRSCDRESCRSSCHQSRHVVEQHQPCRSRVDNWSLINSMNRSAYEASGTHCGWRMEVIDRYYTSES